MILCAVGEIMLPKFVKSISDDTNIQIRDTYAKAGRNDILKIKQLRHINSNSHLYESIPSQYLRPTGYEYKCKFLNS